MTRTINSLVIASAVAALLGSQALARDLWGESGVILKSEEAAVLARVTRLSPETRFEPLVMIDEPAITQPLVAQEQAEQSASALPRQVLTAPPIPGWEPDMAIEELPSPPAILVTPDANQDTDSGQGSVDADVLINPDADEIMIAGEGGTPEPDISGVEMVEMAPRRDPKAPMRDEYEMASVHDPAIMLPSTVEPRVPPPSFDSGAFAGNYAGVGPASGMRLEIESEGYALSGWFVDSSGQIFSVEGEFTTADGRAQAAVISSATVVGYFDLQLTNLGLGALFVPLAEDMTPMVDAAREYEFLRALSAEAQSALEATRSAREAEAESGGGANNRDRAPLRSSSPWDEDRFN